MDILDFYESHSPSVVHTKNALQSIKQRLSNTLGHSGRCAQIRLQPAFAEVLKADDLHQLDSNTTATGEGQSQVQTNGIGFNDDEFDPFSIDSSVFSALDNISDDWFGPFLADLIC